MAGSPLALPTMAPCDKFGSPAASTRNEPQQWGYAHYGAAKTAIAHYTRYLAQDLGPFGITLNSIAPGVIATERIMATVIPGSVRSNRDRAELSALRRHRTVEDCAKVIEFLAADLADYVPGGVIPIDDGVVRGSQAPAFPVAPTLRVRSSIRESNYRAASACCRCRWS